MSSLGPGPILFWNFKIPWNAQKLAEHGPFLNSDLLHNTVHNPTEFQTDTEILKLKW